MSFPNIPNVTPNIDLSRVEVINLLLASIAFEELGLAHIINAEAEKIQFVLGTLPGEVPTTIPTIPTIPIIPTIPTIDTLLNINTSVERVLRDVIKKEMLLQFKLEDVIRINENEDEEDVDIVGLSVGFSAPTYTGNGSNRVGSTTVTLTFALSDGSTITETETFSDINETTSEDFNYSIGGNVVTVTITVITEGEDNSMNIIHVTAEIISIVDNN